MLRDFFGAPQAFDGLTCEPPVLEMRTCASRPSLPVAKNMHMRNCATAFNNGHLLAVREAVQLWGRLKKPFALGPKHAEEGFRVEAAKMAIKGSRFAKDRLGCNDFGNAMHIVRSARRAAKHHGNADTYNDGEDEYKEHVRVYNESAARKC